MSFGVQTLGFTRLMDGIQDLIDIQLAGDTVYVVGTNVEYAIHQEYGTKNMDAQPYLRPAARAVQRSIPRIADQKDPATVEELIKVVALEIENLAARFAPVDSGNLQGSISAEKVQ